MASIFSKAFWNSRGENVDTEKVDAKRNMSRLVSPATLERIRQDVSTWREAINEAESAWFPQRVKMQRMYQDTVLNAHVCSCMERRRDLTLLRDFIITNESGEELEEWTKFFKSPWFYLWMTYGLDALAYGYQLIYQGDLVNNQFPQLSIVSRQNVSPDRLQVGAFVYSTNGDSFMEEPYLNWHTYFSTHADNGRSRNAELSNVPPCGYGYLYAVALPEIYIRNALGANADYVQVFGQPYRVGKTSKTAEYERAEMEATLAGMGSSNWAVLDPEDTIEFIEAKGSGSGNGHMSYDNLITRCEKLISKIILGHADALDSVPGKLGSDGEDSPAHVALMAKKTKDGAYIENAFNLVLVPKLQAIGINFPVGAVGKFKNDEEEEEFREKEDASNKAVAELMKLISDAGGEPDWDYFNERTGLNVEKKEVELDTTMPDPETEDEKKESKNITAKIQNKLDKMYGTH